MFKKFPLPVTLYVGWRKRNGIKREKQDERERERKREKDRM